MRVNIIRPRDRRDPAGGDFRKAGTTKAEFHIFVSGISFGGGNRSDTGIDLASI